MKYLLVAVVLLSGCTMIKKAEDTLDQAKVILADVKATYTEAQKQADQDGDGKVTGTEWLDFVLGIFGVGAVGGSAILARNARSNARKDVMERRIDALEKDLG